MIKPEMVPHGLALIARKAWAEGAGPTNDDDWNAAIAAALNAWPGMCDRIIPDPHQKFITPDYPQVRVPTIILPLLPQETRDDQA